jgi:hypothetical protein
MKVTYSEFFDFVNSRNTDVLLVEKEDKYLIYTVDEAISLEAMLVKGTDDAIDFEDNYKASCNPDKYNKDEMIAWGKVSATISSLLYSEQSPYILDIKFPDDMEYSFFNFFGAWVDVKNYGEDDYILFQLIDKDDILGLGANTVIKEYCELWAEMVAKTTEPIYAPNKSAGKVPAGLYARLIYYPTDVTKINIKLKAKFIVTVE